MQRSKNIENPLTLEQSQYTRTRLNFHQIGRIQTTNEYYCVLSFLFKLSIWNNGFEIFSQTNGASFAYCLSPRYAWDLYSFFCAQIQNTLCVDLLNKYRCINKAIADLVLWPLFSLFYVIFIQVITRSFSTTDSICEFHSKRRKNSHLPEYQRLCIAKQTQSEYKNPDSGKWFSNAKIRFAKSIWNRTILQRDKWCAFTVIDANVIMNLYAVLSLNLSNVNGFALHLKRAKKLKWHSLKWDGSCHLTVCAPNHFPLIRTLSRSPPLLCQFTQISCQNKPTQTVFIKSIIHI